MFGLFRYLLAIIVVIGHLWPQLVPNMGSYAVFGFYILSGYLMALVLTEVYGFSRNGTLTFILNRGLRIYPPYLCVLLISVFIYFIIQPTPPQFATIFILPSTSVDWLKNIFMFDLIPGQTPMLVAVAWSLYVELVYYLLMALLFARDKKITIIWFLLSLFITGYMIFKGYDFNDRYYTVIAGSLPFSTGSMIYFYRDKLRFNPTYLLLISIILYLGNLILTRKLGWEFMNMTGFYISYILSALLVIACLNLESLKLSSQFKKIDKHLGNLSYPIYLCHWLVAIWISSFVFSGNLQRSSSMFFICIIFIHVFAYIIFYLIEDKIETYRKRIRNQSKSKSNLPS